MREGREGFSPCHVETLPAFGQIRRIILPAYVFCDDANGRREIALPDGPDGDPLD
jgi:hypothetical protein